MELYRGNPDIRIFICGSERLFATLNRLAGKRHSGQALVISVAGNAVFSPAVIEAVGRRHFVWHLLVEYLYWVRGLSFEELLTDWVTESGTLEAITAWHESLEPPAHPGAEEQDQDPPQSQRSAKENSVRIGNQRQQSA